MVVFLQDITERKKLESKLNRITRELSTILDTSSIAITMVQNRTQVWANRAMSVTFGYSPDEIKNVETRLFYTSNKEYERFGTEAYPILAQGLEYKKELQMKRKDGSMIWVFLSGNAINQFG